MSDNFNKSVNLFVFLIALVISGCSDTPNEPLVIEDSTDVSRPYASSNPQPSSSQGFFKKRLKSMFSHHDTVWERMLSLYSLPEVNNERVDRELSYFLNRPDYIARVQERAAPYMHLILDEIESQNLPGELALLPVVESAFIPEALSRSAASGLWQFIPSTGRLYGLEQNSWYDGRRDVYASTIAATRFLKDLSEEFNGDYFLALASYNWGKGNVSKAMMRNDYQGLPTDYWSLDMPKETADYVPRLLAVAKLFANADRYGVRLLDIPNKPYCEIVNVGSQLDLDKAAELANTPLSHFMKLNPCYKKGTTSPYGPHRLLVPVKHASAFKQKLAQLPISERVNFRRYEEDMLSDRSRDSELQPERVRNDQFRTENRRQREIIPPKIAAKPRYYVPPASTASYTVHRGETLSAIARNHNTTIEQLKQINHFSKNSVNYGSTLKVPATRRTTTVVAAKKSSKPGKTKTAGGQVYVVKKGDTFYNVSKRFAVSRNHIANWNNISPNGNLKLGQRLVIKGGAVQQVASAASPRLIRYTAKKGDSLMQLSRKFGVSLSDLRKSNPQAGKGIRPGQSIKIVVENSNRAT
ncbi:MAG: LysM peptidoglycan-binding domain-containing protein [Gammaproteobacteria bacterium]|nr:LysM peptidoglycan-binding domain-containing protein [Gammaproteobacteria bacterium]